MNVGLEGSNYRRTIQGSNYRRFRLAKVQTSEGSATKRLSPVRKGAHSLRWKVQKGPKMIGERSENNQNQSIIKAFAENQKCIKSQFSKYKNEIEFDRNALVRNSVHWIPVTRANAGRHTDGAESRRRFRSPSRTKCSCGIGDRPFRPSRESRCSRVSFTRLVATKRCSR